MEDPYLPKAAIVKEDDPDKGVDMKAAFWWVLDESFFSVHY